MNATYEMWSKIMPERAISCTFNIEYLLTGGTDARDKKKPIFMFYDLASGRLGRPQWPRRRQPDERLLRHRHVVSAGRGTGARQPDPHHGVRGDHRLGWPGKWRGGVGARKTSVLGEAENTVISYICDRERAVVWGTNGGLPSMPHGLHIRRAGANHDTWLGSVFSDVPLYPGDVFSRPTAGGGGYGDPLERDPEKVREDVVDDYVSVERAAMDYGVVLKVIDVDLCHYEIDHDATKKARARSACNGKVGFERRPRSSPNASAKAKSMPSTPSGGTP